MTAPPSPQLGPRRRPAVLSLGALAAIVIAVVVAVGSGQGWFGTTTSASPTPGGSVPGVVPPDPNVVAEGRAVPVRYAELASATAGTVESVPLAAGAMVGEGDVLLQLDASAAQSQLAEAQAGVDAAAAGIAQAEASLAQARAGVEIAQAAAEEAAAAVRVADAARDALPGAASDDQERQAGAQVDQAQAGLDRARASRTQARAQVEGARGAVAAARADAARAAAAVTAAEAALADLAIAAPFAGTLVAVEPRVGDVVQPGVPLVRLADLSGWRFETSDLSETSIARVREGASATVTVDALPGEEIAGTVESVGGYGASTQGDITFRVVVAPRGDVPAGVRWNMTVTIEIEGEPAR